MEQPPTSLSIETLDCDLLVVLTDGPGSPGNKAHFGGWMPVVLDVEPTLEYAGPDQR